MSNLSSKSFSGLLIILGLLNIYLGLNVAFGGILTLGWQGQTQFLNVTNENAFLAQDSHIRFFGGLYVAVGLFLILAATNLRKYHMALFLIFFMTFIGGLARFTMGRNDVVFGKAIIVSLTAELILMPVFFIWLFRLVRSNR